MDLDSTVTYRCGTFSERCIIITITLTSWPQDNSIIQRRDVCLTINAQWNN